MSRTLIGRLIFTLLAVFLIVSPYLADWNVTHIYNPRWPPHAKFHNAQTMALGTMLGLAALFCTWRSSSDRVGNVIAATFLTGVYWWTQVAARFYPGTAWTDPEFLKPGQSFTDLGPQGLCCKTDGGDSRWESSGIDRRDAQTCRTFVSYDELA